MSKLGSKGSQIGDWTFGHVNKITPAKTHKIRWYKCHEEWAEIEDIDEIQKTVTKRIGKPSWSHVKIIEKVWWRNSRSGEKEQEHVGITLQ